MKRTSTHAGASEETLELLEQHGTPTALYTLLQSADLPAELNYGIVHWARDDLRLLQALQVNHGWRRVLLSVIHDEYRERVKATVEAFRQWRPATQHFPAAVCRLVSHWLTAENSAHLRVPIMRLETLAAASGDDEFGWIIKWTLDLVTYLKEEGKKDWLEANLTVPKDYWAGVYRTARAHPDETLARLLIVHEYVFAYGYMGLPSAPSSTFANKWLDTLIMLLLLQFKLNINLNSVLLETETGLPTASKFAFFLVDAHRNNNVHWVLLFYRWFSPERHDTLVSWTRGGESEPRIPNDLNQRETNFNGFDRDAIGEALLAYVQQEMAKEKAEKTED